jgi:alkanesulfonate monooxygenase SsuD/methylene tetrahydromethanopterin reductase-like flavin-dependent oxidoreductase (luciferase family)
MFVADSLFIAPQSSPHYLNQFELISILSALAGVTERIGLAVRLTVIRTPGSPRLSPFPEDTRNIYKIL